MEIFIQGVIDWMTSCTDKFIPGGLDFEPLSLISVVAPCAQVSIRFNYCGKPFNSLLPPTYDVMYTKSLEVLEQINAFLNPSGFKAAAADELPQKLLAVHCGLGQYGRNNICYNEEFGSFIRVLSYVSDMPCDETAWFPIRRMDTCKTCRACVSSCPTKAIDKNRNLINSDVCITSINEQQNAFPEWLEKSAHNCLLGCMKCQSCCPKNIKNKNNIIEGVSFTDDETMELLEHKEDTPFSDTIVAKVEAAGISTYIKVLPRNLAALIDNTK